MLTTVISFSLTSVLILLQVALPVYLLLLKIRFWPLGKSVFFLSLIISFLSGALSGGRQQSLCLLPRHCGAVSALIGLLSCPVFLQRKHTLTKLPSPYCFPSCRASDGGGNGRPGLVWRYDGGSAAGQTG